MGGVLRGSGGNEREGGDDGWAVCYEELRVKRRSMRRWWQSGCVMCLLNGIYLVYI